MLPVPSANYPVVFAAPPPRSPQWVGVDLALDYLTGFITTPAGDLETLTHDALVERAIRRRLLTPIFGMARWVRSAAGLRLIDETYGNPIYSYLSAPLRVEMLSQIEADLWRCLKQERRIEVLNIVLRPQTYNRLEVDIYYRILHEEELRLIHTEFVLPEAASRV